MSESPDETLEAQDDIPWGPNGLGIYRRTYSRTKADGTLETWPETVTRVVDGNIGLVDGRFIEPGERQALIDLIRDFKIIPAGRHLWASGVPGRQFLFNCHVSGWGKQFSDHYRFQLLRSAEGGGVGSNYSSRYLEPYGHVRNTLKVHIVCDPEHPDYEEMKELGVLSTDYSSDWQGSWEVGDSREGWADALVELLDTYFRNDVKHQDRVFDVSNVRKRGSRLKTFGGTASGPAPLATMMLEISEILNGAKERTDKEPLGWARGQVLPLEAMSIDHSMGKCVVAGGVRRTARMSIVHWYDRQVFDFIACKSDTGEHWTTNISVEVDQEFFDALEDKTDDNIKNAWAKVVLSKVAHGMLTNGEPGFWNSTLSNVGEPNEVISTNPCGEIALMPWENCNLGHINLDAFAYDEPGAVEAHRLMTRFLIRATYGDVNDDKQRDTLASNRRIGVGHFGYQGWIAKNGIKYSESHKTFGVAQALAWFADEVRDTADKYAFQLRIPSPVKTTTVAPTGTIAKLAGRTEGIHPIYARYFLQRVRYSMSNEDNRKAVNDYQDQGYLTELDSYDKTGQTMIVQFPTKESLVAEVEALGYSADIVESADEISLDDMFAVQAMYQEHYADNAVSFTVNLVPDKVSEKELIEALTKWLPRLKGTTVFPDLSRPQSPFERLTEEEWKASRIQLVADGVDEDCANGACPVR